MHHPSRISRADNIFVYPVAEEDEVRATRERRQTIHKLAMVDLPSRDMSVAPVTNRMSVTMKRRMSVIESYKLRRGSSLYRRISTVDIGALCDKERLKVCIYYTAQCTCLSIKPLIINYSWCEVLVNKKQPRAATLQDLKAMNARIQVKKVIKSHVLKDVAVEQNVFSWSSSALVWFQKVARFWGFCKTLLKSLQPWNDQLKNIHSHFGAEVASFFIFLRWLVYLNIINILVVTCCIVVPQSTPKNPKHNYTVEHQLFNLSDLITGTGWLDHTLLYYGHYSNKTVPSYGIAYDIPLAYALTVCAIGLLNLILIAQQLSATYLQSYLITSEIKHGFCNKLFCSWDYGTDTEEVAVLKKKSVHQELMELLSYKMIQNIKLTPMQSFIRYTSFVCGNFFALALVSGAGILVYYILAIRAVNVTIPFLNVITLPVTVTIILLGLHYILNILFYFEDFDSTQNHLYYNVLRVALMRCGILGVLSYFWLNLRMVEPGDMNCYENLQGQEIYRLIVFNFFVTTFLFTVFAYLWKKLSAIAYLFGYKLKPFGFDISFWTNSLIYYQTLTWIGLFYSPLLPVLTVIIYYFIFNLTAKSLHDNCKPSKAFMSAAQSRTVYLSVTLMCFLLSTMAVAYSLFYVKPSTLCGPFTGQKMVFSVIYSWWGKMLKEYPVIVSALTALESPSLLVTVFVVLCVSVHYSRAYANGQEQSLHYIEHLLMQEGKDKAFLLNLYEQQLFKNSDDGKKS